MNLSTLRALDRWIGIPTCFALTLWRRVTSPLRRRALGPVQRILFVKPAEQGSTVLAVSAIQKAIELVGRENVYFMAFEENRFILDLMELIPRENVIGLRTQGIAGTLLQSLTTVRRLRALRVDAAIDLEFFARSSAIFTYLSGAARRIGFHRSSGEGPYRGDLMTHRMRFTPHLHTSQLFRLLADAIDLDPARLPTIPFTPTPTEDLPPPFRPGPEELERVRAKIAAAAGTESFRPLLLLNANCSDLIPLRAWPRDRYVALARRMLAEHPALRIAFTGAPVEAPAAERLVAEIASPRCFSLAGKTSLRELLVAFMHAEVMVTNDSGPAHFASLTPIEVVTLFGPEHPAIFGSRNPRSHVVWTGLACSPCVSALNNRETACRENLCMQSIEVDTVGAIVSGLLSPCGGAERDASGDRPLPVLRAAWQPRLARTADAPIDHS